MIITFIDNSSLNALTQELTELVRHMYTNEDFVAEIQSIEADYTLDLVTLKIGYGTLDNHFWKNVEVDTDLEIELNRLLGIIQQSIITCDKVEG